MKKILNQKFEIPISKVCEPYRCAHARQLSERLDENWESLSTLKMDWWQTTDCSATDKLRYYVSSGANNILLLNPVFDCGVTGNGYRTTIPELLKGYKTKFA